MKNPRQWCRGLHRGANYNLEFLVLSPLATFIAFKVNMPGIFSAIAAFCASVIGISYLADSLYSGSGGIVLIHRVALHAVAMTIGTCSRGGASGVAVALS